MKKYRMMVAALCVGIATAAEGATIPITWLDMSPTAVGSTFPSGTAFNVPGVGNVTVTYSIPGNWTSSRLLTPGYTTGSVTSAAPDTYPWTNYEQFATIFGGAVPLGPVVGTITYTFPSTLPANSVYVGTIGLGATTNEGGGMSTTTVGQNGTFLGEFVGDVTAGASTVIDTPGTFTVQNSVTGAGGVNPHWNTNLAVIRIDDAVSSVTITQSQLRGDGVGVNIGFAVSVITPSCDFNNCKAKKIKTSMVRAFTPCGEPGGNSVNSSLDGILPACAPPQPLSLYNFKPPCDGSCTVQIKTKIQYCGIPAQPCCCITTSTSCKGILAPSSSPASGTFSLAMVLRITGNDASNGDVTSISTPFNAMMQAINGKIKHKSGCVTIPPDGVIPACSSVELVDLAILDPDGDRFAVPGVSCCSK